jgi:hypothetical protein
VQRRHGKKTRLSLVYVRYDFTFFDNTSQFFQDTVVDKRYNLRKFESNSDWSGREKRVDFFVRLCQIVDVLLFVSLTFFSNHRFVFVMRVVGIAQFAVRLKLKF